MLALNLPTSIPEACPGDLLYVWDATQVNTLLWSLPDQGADPSEDCINVSCLAKEMRWGPCGTLGIVEGLAFFVNTCGLKLEQFEIKILKLVKALKKSRKQLHVPFKVPYGKGKGVEAISEDEVELQDADLGSDIEVGVSDIKDNDDIDDTQLSSDGEGQPHQPQYNRGPFPTALVDEVHGVTEAFHHTLEAMAKKYNCLLHQEKEWFNGDADGLEAWLDDLQSLAQQLKVDKDIQVTSGTKLTKYIYWKKKLLMGEIQHMATFDAHVVAFIVCSRPDAYAAHAQNAILFGSSEIQQLAKKQFNLKKSLEELFVKLMNERLDATGILKWNEEAEKVQDGNAVCHVQDAGLDFGSESTMTSTRHPKLTSWKSQKAPASAAKSKGIVRSTRIQSKPFIDESDSDSLDFDNLMALASNSPMTSSHSVVFGTLMVQVQALVSI
ncbi:hypothetical protein BS47DRAFT_1357203 [Hydnum rufescens UP504]|uniref:Uncharacterized protein n=1 Tax=Hydnum rufescens UP504 TaxID=1448309 RepID=A0A9P6E2C9_9AGAM|nr:hypothetical protein BS47DRAFT_1357203 [Hydnum rufescens UP504]